MSGVWVTSFKDGLLSRVAHDVQLRLHRFTLTRDGDALTFRGQVDSLVVEGAVERGRLNDKRLTEKDRRDILDNVHRKILDTRRNPEVVFRGDVVRNGLTATCEGTLTLDGHTQPLTVSGRVRDGVLAGRVELTPSRWGIQPFRALMGAIKLQDRLEVRFELPFT